MSTDYQPKPGDEVLLTVRATVDDGGDYRLPCARHHAGPDAEVWLHRDNEDVIRVEPAPVKLPTDLGAVILAEVTDCSTPGRLMLVSGGPYPEDGYRWVHVDRPDDTYNASEITRVHAVLLPGESGG